ncbi:hypothetical protein Tco_0917909 [Tanacetum coccineum]
MGRPLQLFFLPVRLRSIIDTALIHLQSGTAAIQLSVQYSVFIQSINTAYSLLLNTAYQSSGTKSESLVFVFDFRA